MHATDNKGFTLIELLIVVAIFAIGSAIALPSLMDMGRSGQVKTEARQLKDQLARARATAIEQNSPVIIQFIGNSYAVNGQVTSISNATLTAVTIDQPPPGTTPLATFQWQQRGYPTTVAGSIGDIDPIEITITPISGSKSFDILISPVGSITIN
ncbi:MAG: prepilin-type N-terminal cleavage/methylation domain-containing protein [Deltaproteobacteria bacterium]|nr:prepilin-type N-terminal cleavage/methylation domain-containing protein [Deltaproteobacteria bacterium]